MRSTSRMPVWVSILSGMTAAGLLIVAGCALDKPGNGPQGVFNRIGGHGEGQLIEPKRCLVKVIIVNRPFDDPAINDAVWRAADEQIISPKERHALEANGLRIGRIIGELPQELEAILDDGGPQNPKVIPTNLLVESGQQQLISISEPVEQVSLLVNRDSRVSGKDYKTASGYFRLTPQHQGAHGVSVRLTPEIHHGPVQRTFPAMPNTGGFAPQELSIRDSQREEAIHELSVDIMLEPGQVAVIGCRPEIQRSLGSFLFSESPTETDQRHQKLILIWASRNQTGVADERAKGGDRPKLFQRLIKPPPAEPSSPDQTPKPAPPPDRGPAATSTKPAKSAAKTTVTPPSPDVAPVSTVPPPDSQAPPLPK
ncbi:MAG: hypothetical protein ACLQGP_19015 [Isosphaeraceae bacterium]